MRKKIIMFAAVVLSVAAMVTGFAMAASDSAPEAQAGQVVAQAPAQEAGFDIFSLMMDSNGQPVSEDVLNANIDKAIADGKLEAKDKAAMIAMFNFCISGGMSGMSGMPCGDVGSCPFSN